MPRLSSQDALSEDELDRLLAQPNPGSPTGKRNLALLLVMADAGLRVSEAIALSTNDLVVEGGQITHVRIRRGKGARPARQPLTLRAAAKLGTWLQGRAGLGLMDGAIFCTISEGHCAGYFARPGERLQPGKPVSATYVRQLVKRLARSAQITRDISPHTLRHTAVTRYLRATGNLELTRKFARHARIDTTARIYSHLVQRDVDDGVKLLPGNRTYEALGAEEPQELAARIAELEVQLAALKQMVSERSRQQGIM